MKINYSKYILNCDPSINPLSDWGYAEALEAELISFNSTIKSKDLREDWWEIRDQGNTGACVGFATADSLLRWHYVQGGLIDKGDLPSPRFIWMANKETDNITNYPTSFIDRAGTQTKLALRVARNYGCVMENALPMKGGLSKLSTYTFYTKASKLRISSYHNLGKDPQIWRRWIANQGPILTRLNVDQTWDQATQNGGRLEEYKPNTTRGGHAVALVGFSPEGFIVRNSWGKNWGDIGFAYASNSYAQNAFTEAYGAVL